VNRASSSPIATGSVGLNGTSSNSTLLGRWVNTMVLINPIRPANRPETS